MSAQRNRNDPHPLAPDDPGEQGEDYGLRIRHSTAKFEEALKRAGHAPRNEAGDRATADLLSLLADKGRR
jgi:hypothetical protein